MNRFLPLLVSALLAALPSPLAAAGKLSVIASTEDLASIAREVGGDRVSVEALAKGYQDPHFVEAKPSFVLKLNRADLLIAVGRELEAAWLPQLITQSRNGRLQVGSPGYLDASETAVVLDIPSGQITRSMGDVHPLGNPHYWLDPANGRRIAQAIQKRLAALAPPDAGYFAQRLADFERRLSEAEKRWDAAMAPFKGTKVVTYHRSWSNFAARFGLNVVGFVEPRPGIPPSPAHTLRLIQEMKQQGVKIVLMEPYFDPRTPKSIARETGATLLVLPPSVGAEKEITDYLALFEYDIRVLVSALKATGTR